MASSIFLFLSQDISASVLGRLEPVPGTIVGISGQGKLPEYRSWLLVDTYFYRLTHDIAPSPSLSWKTCPRLLAQYWRYNLLGHCTDPWRRCRLRVPDLRFWSESSYLCTYWAWILVTFFCQYTFWLISFRGTRWFSLTTPFGYFYYYVVSTICVPSFVRAL